jgi:hypothetical protein
VVDVNFVGDSLPVLPGTASTFDVFFITTLHGPRRKHSLSTLRKAHLQCLVACVFVAAGMCLPSRCLAMSIYFEFAIPALGRHITI